MNDFEKTEQKRIAKLVSLGFEEVDGREFELVANDVLIRVQLFDDGVVGLTTWDYINEKETRAGYRTFAPVMRKIKQLMA